MRNKKAKALRKLANRFAQLEELPERRLVANHNGSLFHAKCAREIYKTMKRRYHAR